MKPLQRCSDGRCGASDCPRCSHGCDDIVECDACGATEYVCYADERGWTSSDGTAYCPECERYYSTGGDGLL